MTLSQKDVLGLEEMPVEEIVKVLDTADSFKEVLSRPVRKLPTLQGKSVLTLFYEPSTRTRTSFERAAHILGADCSNIATATSSVVKGETLKDTILTVRSIGFDVIVIRHSMSGAPHLAAKLTDASVINAGDGTHEHPTQGLLDMLTIRQHKGKLEGLKVAFLGDILHSRVARSTTWGLAKLGAQVTFCAPPTMMPPHAESIGGARVTQRLEEAVGGADVVYLLRIQLERQKAGLFPSGREYARLFGMNLKKYESLCPGALVMHPGPINRGLEISADLADSDHAIILEQVTNGVAVRMALLHLLLGGGEAK